MRRSAATSKLGWQCAGVLPTLIAVTGGVFSVLYYLRPLPDLFAAVRADGVVSRPILAPGLIVATMGVLLLSFAPGVAWYLARPA